MNKISTIGTCGCCIAAGLAPLTAEAGTLTEHGGVGSTSPPTVHAINPKYHQR